jgi:hypothetical protein
MREKRLSIGLRAALAIFTVTLFVTSTWAATHEKVLHNFNNNGTDGSTPVAGLGWRHLRPGDGVRVNARRGRKLDGEGVV